MAAPKKDTPLRSPLLSSLNNIVSINRSKSAMRSTQSSYNEFLRFMSVEVKNLEAIKLPDNRKLKKLSNINVTSTFGSAGNLLSGLASGALDAAGLVGDFFGGRKKNPRSAKPIPKGTKIRLPGVRGLPIISTALAGLDFASGIAGGESVGKAGAGALGSAAGAAGGALAGSALAGVIGQALVPVPGLGFVLGAAVGSLGGMAGGYLADRAYEAATGEGKVKEKTKARLKEQEQKQKIEAASLTTLTFPQVLDKFDSVVTQFQRSIQNLTSETPEISTWEEGETKEDKIDYRPEGAEEFTPGAPTGAGDEVFPLVGGRPTFTMGAGLFNASRDGGARRHSAQDIGVDPNTPVVASRSGTVLQAYSSGYGDVGGAVVIRYDNGQQGLYGHTLPNVKVGDKVKAGQKIAKVAPDGNNTHLHYMRKDTRGNYIDPLPILRQSKSGVPIVQGQKQESKKDLEKQSMMSPNTADVTRQNKMMSKSTQATKPSQDLSKMSTDQLRGMLDSTKTSVSNPAVFKAAQEARIKGQESGLTGDNLERSVMIASIRAKNAESQVMAMSQQPVSPQKLQQYPSYNTPQNSVTVIPMMMGGSSGGSQQRPMVVSSGGGGGGTTIMPPVPQGQVLNSLFNTMLLTNLSGS